MFNYFTGGPAQYLPVGLLVIFSFLLIYTVLTSVFRLSKKWNSTFVFVFIASVSGIINGACLLYFSSNGMPTPDYNVLIAVILFGLAIGTLAWVPVFSVFSAITGKSIQVKLGYLLTFIQIILIVTATAIYGVGLNIYTNYFYTYEALITAIISLRWLYLVLFLSLIVRYRQQLNGLGKTVLIAFGILSTGRLITDTVFLSAHVVSGTTPAYTFIMFFFTDFLSALSMFLLVTFYKNMMVKNDHMYDN